MGRSDISKLILVRGTKQIEYLNAAKVKELGEIVGEVVAVCTAVTKQKSTVYMFLREFKTGKLYSFHVCFTELSFLGWKFGVYPGMWVGNTVRCFVLKKKFGKNVREVITIQPVRRGGAVEEPDKEIDL